MKNSLTLTQKFQESALIKLDAEEKRIVLAYQGAKRFQHFDNEDKKRLAKSLVRLSYFVGIKEPISLESVTMLTIFLCNEYPNLTIEELEQGVQFCCSGKLGSFEHFQNFSPIYLGKIINAYQLYTSQAKTKFARLVEEEKRKIKENEIEQSFDKKQGLLNTILTEYDNYLKSGGYNEDSVKMLSEVVAQTCVMYLNTYDFFQQDKKDKSPFVTLKNYFVTLPANKNEAIEQIKKDVNVCYQRKNKQY